MKVVELLLQIIQEMVIMELLLPFLEIQQLIHLGNQVHFQTLDTIYYYAKTIRKLAQI